MSLLNRLLDQLFLSSPVELMMLLLIIFLASIVRGAIGFGFSALLVASTSFWLPPVSVVTMTVVLEVVASLIMMRNVKTDIQYRLLIPLASGTALASMFGVYLLSIIHTDLLQLLIASYLTVICVLSLIQFRFKPEPSTIRLAIVGSLAGLFNGLAAIGGVLIALFLTGSGITVSRIRATMVIYFFISEAAFMAGALLSDVYSKEIFYTSLIAIPVMFVGIHYGTRLFNYLPEARLRRMVLVALILISGIGLIKTQIT